MRPSDLRWLGALCLAASAALGASAGSVGGAGDAASALGGARAVVVGSLFLRAEALRREGRVEDLPAIYRRILEIDPTSDAAADHLAGTLASDLRPLATTPQARVRWWREALALVDAGLAHSPRSARLHWRRGDLLLRVAGGDEAVAQSLAVRGRDREVEAVESLAASARLSGGIPRLGRIHLETIARQVPRIAAERLASGRPGVEAVLAAGNDVLRRRAPELDDLRLDEGASTTPASAHLRGGLRLVEVVRDYLAARPPRLEDARRLLATYEGALGEDAVAKALAPLLR